MYISYTLHDNLYALRCSPINDYSSIAPSNLLSFAVHIHEHIYKTRNCVVNSGQLQELKVG